MIRVPLAHYPGMNRFVLDWLGKDERFLPRSSGGQALLPVQKNRTGRIACPPLPLVESNQHWGNFVDLSAWERGETRTIVAGQQVGFAGGPLYTIAKIATLIRMKRDLEQQGEKVTAFFWLATEDHDFDEVAQLNVPVAALAREKDVNRQLDLVCMRAIRSADSRAVVGSLPVPETLVSQLLSLLDIERPPWLREGITFRDSFAELIAEVCKGEVVLVDALLPELRRAGAPLFEQIREREEEIQRTLSERGEELKAAGYNEQVAAHEDGRHTLLYEIDEHGRRQPPTAHRQPETTSTSALTRPLLQDFVLQPDIFVGGPAEVAYYAQLAPLHELLGITMPRIALRGHVLVAPQRVTRAFSRYGIDPCDVFSSADALLAEKEPEGVARIRELADEAKRELMQRVQQINELALPAGHSLAGSIQRSIGHLEYHSNKLAERAIKGLVRKDRERYAAARELVATLYPDRNVQDRVVSWFAFYAQYRTEFFERVLQEVEPDSAWFRIVEL